MFGDSKRLRSLAEALDVPESALVAVMDQVKADAPVHDRLLASGLEDFGELPLADVFVCSPLRGRQGSLDEDDLQALCFPTGQLSREKHPVVSVAARPSLGATTLLMRIATWGTERGYAVELWHGGALPKTRGALVIGDRVPVSARRAVEEWCKEGDRRAVIGLDPSSPLAELRADVVLEPIDDAWLRSWCAKVAKLPVDARRWLPSDRLPLIRAVLASGRALGPEAATTALRWLAQRPPGSELDVVSAVADALRRRGAADGSLPSPWALRALSTMPVADALRIGVVDDVQADLLRPDLRPTTRRILTDALPSIDLSGRVVQLVDLGLLRTSAAGPVLRFEGLLHPTADASLAGVIEALESAPAEEALRRWMGVEPRRAAELRWTATAFERCVALSLVTQLLSVPKGYGVLLIEPVYAPIGACADVVVDRLQRAVATAAADLEIAAPKLSEDQLAYALALANLAPEPLADERIWRVAAETECLPRHWLAALRDSAQLVPVLLDPDGSEGAAWFLSHGGATDVAADLLGHLATIDDARFASCVGSILEWTTGSLPTKGVSVLDVLRPLDAALAMRPARQAFRRHVDEFRPQVLRLLDVVEVGAWEHSRPRLGRLVTLILDASARRAAVREASQLAGRVTAFAALDLLENEDLVELLGRISTGGLRARTVDPGADAHAASCEDVVFEHALRLISLEDAERVWPGAREQIAAIVRKRAPGQWRGWPAAIAYCFHEPGPYTHDHPLWRVIFELRLSVATLGIERGDSKVAAPRQQTLKEGRTLNLRRSALLAEMQAEKEIPHHRWSSELLQSTLARALEHLDAPSRWARLVAGIAERAASRADVLIQISPKHVPVDVGPDVVDAVSAIVESARRERPRDADLWLIGLLQERPDVADLPAMAGRWSTYDGDRSYVETFLAGAHPQSSSVGAGVMAVYSETVDLQRWLNVSATEQAAWERSLLVSADPGALANIAAEPRTPIQARATLAFAVLSVRARWWPGAGG